MPMCQKVLSFSLTVLKNHKDRIYEDAEEIKMSMQRTHLMQRIHLLAIALYRQKYVHNLEMAYECDGTVP